MAGWSTRPVVPRPRGTLWRDRISDRRQAGRSRPNIRRTPIGGSGQRGTFDRGHPSTLARIQRNDHVRLGVYSMYGSEVGVSLSIMLNPDQRPAGGMGGVGPIPVSRALPGHQPGDLHHQLGDRSPRPRSADPQPEFEPRAREDRRSNPFGSAATRRKCGSATRSMMPRRRRPGEWPAPWPAPCPPRSRSSRSCHSSNGLAGAKVTLRRSDLERLEFAPDAGSQMRAVVAISAGGRNRCQTRPQPRPLPQVHLVGRPLGPNYAVQPVRAPAAHRRRRIAGQLRIRPGSGACRFGHPALQQGLRISRTVRPLTPATGPPRSRRRYFAERRSRASKR